MAIVKVALETIILAVQGLEAALAFVRSGVTIFTTPPMAYDPNRLEDAPRTISTRSITGFGTRFQKTLPKNPPLMGMPSTNTNERVALSPTPIPRMAIDG